MALGERIATVAHFEPGARFDTRWVETRARRAGEDYLLDGRKAVVLQAGLADTLLVSARTAGAGGDPDGISLFLVPRTTPGLTLEEYLNVDGQSAADVSLDGVRLAAESRLGDEGAAFASIESALDAGLAALCAEAVSIMQELTDSTVAYLNTRQQFGQPIGRFQALQHRIADMVIHLEQARSMSYLAAMRCDCADLRERRRIRRRRKS